MQRISKVFLVVIVAGGLTFVGASPGRAQSGSRSYPPRRPARSADSEGSSRKAPNGTPLALEGYCPVSILMKKKWVRGEPAYRSVYDGRTYLFANALGKKMFDQDPAKFVPALGGDSVVAFVELGKRVRGNIRYAALHDGRLFLFSNSDEQRKFLAAPTRYANADLALGGHCPVCRVNLGKEVAGKPEIAAFYKGMRYLFPSEDLRREFLRNPEKYVSGRPRTPRAGSGSSTR